LQAKQARDHAGPMKAGEWNVAMRDHDASTISQKKNKATAAREARAGKSELIKQSPISAADRRPFLPFARLIALSTG